MGTGRWAGAPTAAPGAGAVPSNNKGAGSEERGNGDGALGGGAHRSARGGRGPRDQGRGGGFGFASRSIAT
jgi:hypothetical protein